MKAAIGFLFGGLTVCFEITAFHSSVAVCALGAICGAAAIFITRREF